MYDVLQSVKLQLQLQFGEYWYRALLRRVPKFVLQLAVFFRSYHDHDCELRFKGTMISEMLYWCKCSRTRNRTIWKALDLQFANQPDVSISHIIKHYHVNTFWIWKIHHCQRGQPNTRQQPTNTWLSCFCMLLISPPLFGFLILVVLCRSLNSSYGRSRNWLW